MSIQSMESLDLSVDIENSIEFATALGDAPDPKPSSFAASLRASAYPWIRRLRFVYIGNYLFNCIDMKSYGD